MIFVLSPAKSLDLEPQSYTKKHTQPDMLEHSQELIDRLAKLSKAKVATLMGISDKLAELNVDRFRAFQQPFDTENAKQAILMFKGDVYQGFEFDGWKAADFTFAQKHLRMLSGLYGVLKPLDLIQAYRLEMGTRLKTDRGKDLYDFWGSLITESLAADVKATRSKAFVNLASNEYFKSVDANQLGVPIVTPVFKDEKNGKYKIISFFAKKARGMMAEFITRNRIKNPAKLRDFDTAGYAFEAGESTESQLVFHRAAAE